MRLKRRNRWLLGAIFLVAGRLVAPKVFETTAIRVRAQGAGTSEQIRALGFILEDEKGKPRAGLLVDKNGPSLPLRDEKDKKRADLSMLKYGPLLSLLTKRARLSGAL